MQRFFLLIALCLPAIPAFAGEGPTAAGDGPTVVPSSLQSVMVYRSGAEMVHTARARLAQGNSELIIDDVSTTLDPASIRISCGGNVTIMGVSFSKDYLQPETVSPFVRRLQDSIEVLAREQERLNILTKSDEQALELLNSNKNIGGTQNGVSASELAKMMDYYRQQQVSIRTELGGYADKVARLKGSRENLQNQIAEEEAKNTKTSGRILLQVLSPLTGSYDFTVSYLTAAAHWEPAYDLKVTGSNDPLQLFYKARLVQSSGIDWKHVKLSLSTSMPSQGGNAPVLKARFLRFAEALVSVGYGNMNVANTLSGRVAGAAVPNGAPGSDVEYRIRGSKSDGSLEQPLYIVDGTEMSGDDYSKLDPKMIGDIQVLKGDQATSIYGSRAASGVIVITLKNGVGDYLSVSDNQLDVVFDIDIPYDIPSNGREQGVELKEYKVPCTYQYYAAPVADKEAYLLGQMQGWEKLNLLPGEASITVEGTYIGKSFIDPGSTQDTLNLTLGQDKRIVVKREKVKDFSSVKFLGSNKKEVFTYEITVRNNKKDKVRLLLKDQYPISTDKDIEDELLDSGGATVNKDTGVLTWRVELAPGESRQYRISYSVKYPKDKTVNLY
jgi:TonB-dependent SusC/RagA subfamily outer membrane receptor